MILIPIVQKTSTNRFTRIDMMTDKKIEIGSVLLMKKKHPCGSFSFKVVRIGSDVRIICEGCSRDLTVSRENLEKMVKKVETST